MVGEAGQLWNMITFTLAEILEYLGYLGYIDISYILNIPCIFLQYIYIFISWEIRDVFNSNLIIISIIVSSYKFINISYYIYLISNLDIYRMEIFLILSNILRIIYNILNINIIQKRYCKLI